MVIFCGVNQFIKSIFRTLKYICVVFGFLFERRYFSTDTFCTFDMWSEFKGKKYNKSECQERKNN